VFALPRLARPTRPGAAARSSAWKIIPAENGGEATACLTSTSASSPARQGPSRTPPCWQRSRRHRHRPRQCSPDHFPRSSSAGSAVKSAPLAWATCPFHQVMGGADPLPFPRPGTARRRPPPQSARHLPPEEKNMVIPPEAPPGSGVSRHADWQTSGRRTMVVIVTLLLAAAFVLAGANTSPQCRGEQPGVCPYSRLA
jgi:hypothetical protein